MVRKILVLLETATIPKKVIQYSIGLAKRTNSVLTLLLILRPDFWEELDAKHVVLEKTPELERASKEILESHISDIEREGVGVNYEMCIGDPSSEFLKFLAKNSPFQTVIWGGANIDKKGKSLKIEDHWLGRVKNAITCPLVVPRLSER